MKENGNNMITLNIYSTMEEAEIMKNKLAFYEIDSFISTDDVGGLRPDMQLTNGVRLMVLQKDAERALEVVTEPVNTKSSRHSDPPQLRLTTCLISLCVSAPFALIIYHYTESIVTSIVSYGIVMLLVWVVIYTVILPMFIDKDE